MNILRNYKKELKPRTDIFASDPNPFGGAFASSPKENVQL